MQAEGQVAVTVVGQPNAGVKGYDFGPPYQNDVHNDRQGAVLCWGVHAVAILAHHADCHILHSSAHMMQTSAYMYIYIYYFFVCCY